jgi:signal transduction histidine kinase
LRQSIPDRQTATAQIVRVLEEMDMRFASWALAFSIVATMAGAPALAQDRGTPDQAKALAEKAAAHMKDVGPQKAVADFDDPKGGYQDRDLFVFVYAPDNKLVSSAGVPALLGRDVTTFKDVDGKEFAKQMIATAQANPAGGWVEYRMTNPVTKKVEPKKSYAIRIGDYTLGSGAYNP